MKETLGGRVTPTLIAGFGVAIRLKGKTAGELRGLAETMLARATPIDIPGRIVDLVGTGGGRARTVHISPMPTAAAAPPRPTLAKHGPPPAPPPPPPPHPLAALRHPLHPTPHPHPP